MARGVEDGERPKIGLVLGGGGAKGLAHLGVLKWLEKNQVPIDFVAGTSMGGLIGSLVSMGWTADEVESLLGSLEWERLLASSPPFEILSYRRKADIRQFPSHFELGLKNGLSVPGGLNPGHFIGLLFDRLTLPYSDLESFDDLPIPFRCVATDMEDGRPVVLANGDLSTALRATMAIPGVFNPVERDGRILADGGLLDNLPADVAKEMGADFVLAVQVGSPLEDREQLQSFLGMLNQSVTIMMLDNVRRSQKVSDIILSPEIGEFGTLEFNRTAEIVEKGYEAAEQKRILLDSLSLSQDEWKKFVDARNQRRRRHYPVPSELVVKGVTNDERLAIEKKVEPVLGESINPDELEDKLTSVYGSGRYYSVGYSVKDSSSLLVRAARKGYGPPFVRFGFLVDGSEFDSVRFGISTRFSFFDLGG
ncbi:MAG: patatin-like phospholipase family protein, partial [bacterium]